MGWLTKVEPASPARVFHPGLEENAPGISLDKSVGHTSDKRQARTYLRSKRSVSRPSRGLEVTQSDRAFKHRNKRGPCYRDSTAFSAVAPVCFNPRTEIAPTG